MTSDTLHVLRGHPVRIYRRLVVSNHTLVWWHRINLMLDGSDAPGRRAGGQFGMLVDPALEVSTDYVSRRDPLSRELRLVRTSAHPA